ncbi:MAG TPA: diadenylate cyclase [Acidimicrobiales bacterium]|nr:diadenylate cyclase [Acidimicrobiales bacterium]
MGEESRRPEDSRRATRLRRLAEDLTEAGYEFRDDEVCRGMLLDEVRHAIHPPVHERRVARMGSIIDPRNPPEEWARVADLEVLERPLEAQPLDWARRFADGRSSWLVRRPEGRSSWVVFDRPAGSERDLSVLVRAFDATVVQRHENGTVRVADRGGVWRWERFDWHHEPDIESWIDLVGSCGEGAAPEVLRALLEFAVHDLGADGIGAILVLRPDTDIGPAIEARLPLPPPLDITRPMSLAPLRHALAQVDGAAVFDPAGTLRQLGVRLVPSPEAERVVDGLQGMRHTSSRRYSYDDPLATVVVVSEDGPVTVLRKGEVVGTSLRPRYR